MRGSEGKIVKLEFQKPKSKTNQLIEDLRRSNDITQTFINQPDWFRDLFLSDFFKNLQNGSSLHKNFAKSYIMPSSEQLQKLINHAFSEAYSISQQIKRLDTQRSSLNTLIPDNLNIDYEILIKNTLVRSLKFMQEATGRYHERRGSISLNKEQYIQGLQLSNEYQAIYNYTIKLLSVEKDQDKREVIKDIQQHITIYWKELIAIMIDNFIAKVHHKKEQDSLLQYKNPNPKSKYYHTNKNMIEYGQSKINTQPIYDYIASTIDNNDFISINDLQDKEEFIRQMTLSAISGELDDSFSNIDHKAIDINLWKSDDLSEIGEKCDTINNNLGIIELYFSNKNKLKASYKKEVTNDEIYIASTE